MHVHEPFAPSTSNAALRHSRALNVGSFHSSSERLLSTLVARRFVESFFGRLDARTASLPATAELMARHFPGDYRLVRTTRGRGRARADLPRAWPRAGTPPEGTRRCAPAVDAAADRGRPAHAHRPLLRLRDARGGAARERPRAGPGRDRGDRPQRDLRRARGAGAGEQIDPRRAPAREGDRRRGGQDGRRGRGDRPVHRARRSRAG